VLSACDPPVSKQIDSKSSNSLRGGFAYLKWFEALLIMFLFSMLFAQLASNPLTTDPDPDGYFSYARYLEQHWRLPEHHVRMPGYPLFLAIVDVIGAGDLPHDAFIAQAAASFALVVGLWWFVRRSFGPVVALAFLLLYAMPNYSVFLSTVGLADFLFQALWLAFLVAGLNFIFAARHAALKFFALVFITFLAYAVHPGTLYLGLFLALSSVCAIWLSTRFRNPVQRCTNSRAALTKCALVFLCVITVAKVSDVFFDRGKTEYLMGWLGWRLVVYLPPSSNTELDRRIEHIKQRVTARLGYPVQYESPITHPEFLDLYDVSTPKGHLSLAEVERDPSLRQDIRFYHWSLPVGWHELAMGRLINRPLVYAASVINVLRWHQHIIVKQFFPFCSEKRLVTTQYLPLIDSPASKLFRLTGIELREQLHAPARKILAPAILAAIQILTFYGLTIFGAVLLARRYALFVMAIAGCLCMWICFICLSNPPEPRYINIFAPMLVMAHAAALVAIAAVLLERLSALTFRVKLQALASQLRQRF
jgi:hypothetical protein